MADRAVSTAVSYVIMIGVAAILLVGLTMAANGIVDTQNGQTTRTELEVYGERLAADIAMADRLAQQDAEASTDVTTVSVTSELPETASGDQYTIELENDGDATTITLESDGSDASVETGVTHTTPIDTDDDVSGGALTIEYESGELVIRSD